MKKTASVFLAILTVLCILTGCSSGQNATEERIIETVSPINETVELHTTSQSAFLNGSNSMILLYAQGKREKSRPKPVKFEWDYNGAVSDFTLSISENSDMTDCKTYTTDGESYSVYNLKIGTTYFWTVSAGETCSEISSFTTSSEAPRNLYIDGITNARDLGGRTTENGTVTKQGMIFRCGRLNESDVAEPNIEITEAGKNTMLNDLGIKTEIDVRLDYNDENGGITSSPLGDTVNYINCPMNWEGEMLAGNKEQILKVFSILADESNYPLFIHCNIGTDRTGMLSFLINALLGVSEEDLYKDYLFSNFGKINGNRPLDNLLDSDYYAAVQAAEGSTLSEKTYNCLVSTGVPAEQLDSLIKIMTTE